VPPCERVAGSAARTARVVRPDGLVPDGDVPEGIVLAGAVLAGDVPDGDVPDGIVLASVVPDGVGRGEVVPVGVAAEGVGRGAVVSGGAERGAAERPDSVDDGVPGRPSAPAPRDGRRSSSEFVGCDVRRSGAAGARRTSRSEPDDRRTGAVAALGESATSSRAGSAPAASAPPPPASRPRSMSSCLSRSSLVGSGGRDCRLAPVELPGVGVTPPSLGDDPGGAAATADSGRIERAS
jgi:hypothetical protein